MMSTAQQHLDAAARHEDRASESFERCDTDGFLSQWASGLSAQLERAKAEIVANGGTHIFTGLYQGDRRVLAKLVNTKWGLSWVLHESETELIAARGKKFLPACILEWKSSRVLKKLGLRECDERDKAWADFDGRGTGLSGTCYVSIFRTGDKWGSDAELLGEQS